MTVNYDSVLADVLADIHPMIGQGTVASYIPALSAVPVDSFGMAIQTVEGGQYRIGDADVLFSVQSISKVFLLVEAVRQFGESLWQRVGIEPSGNPFNSLVQLEYENGIPRNPFINAGALVVADALLDVLDAPADDMLDLVGRLTGRSDISFDEGVYRSEIETGHTNRALANFMKSYGNIRNDIDDVLAFYYQLCSLSMSCESLCSAFAFLANAGVVPVTGEQVLTRSQCKRINAVMLTCGFYDQAGEFAFRVGLPGKSGVGGGIVAVIPGEMVVTTWSPGLNANSNSLAGMAALEAFTSKTGVSIF